MIVLVSAIHAALVANEIGGDLSVAYRLSFAGCGASGASFGVFQADCAANPMALHTLMQALGAASAPMDATGRILGALRSPCARNPLSAADTSLVDAALSSAQGRALVDALDQHSIDAVTADLALAMMAAGGSIEAGAQIAIALWCNMSGRPTLLLQWLGGEAITEGHIVVAKPANPVTLDDIDRYLNSTTYFTAHPQNWQHFAASVQSGIDTLSEKAV